MEVVERLRDSDGAAEGGRKGRLEGRSTVDEFTQNFELHSDSDDVRLNGVLVK